MKTDESKGPALLELELEAPGGYPSEASLERIAAAPIRTRADCVVLLEAVRGIWAFGSVWTSDDGDVYNLATGGWSGNEDVIEALSRNWAFWALCWEQSSRGGHHAFVLPAPAQNDAGGPHEL